MFCTNCGANNPDGAKFCTTCGAPLGAAEEVSVPQPETEESQSPVADSDMPAETISYDAVTPQNSPEETSSSPFTSGPQEVPQSWPDYDNPDQGQNGGKKKSKKIMIIAIVAAVIVAAIIAVVGFTLTGVISFGGGGEEAATEETEAAASDEADEKSDEKAQDEEEEEKSDKKSSSAANYLEADFYDDSPVTIQNSLEDLGFEFADAYASGPADDTYDYPPVLYVTFTGDVDSGLPNQDSDEVEILLSIELTGDEGYEYDSYGIAEGPIESLADIPEDYKVDYAYITYESDAGKDEYVSMARDIVNICGLDDPDSISASDDELASAAGDEFKSASSEATDDYIGDVLFLYSSDWSISIMGGEDLGGSTYVEVDLII